MPIDKIKLTEAMIEKEMNMSDLAKKSEVSKSQISRLMKEDTKKIRLDTLGKIANALEIDYKALYIQNMHQILHLSLQLFEI